MDADLVDALHRLHAAASRFADWQAPTFGPPATTDEIAALRATLDIPLTARLKQFLTQHRAIVAMDIWNGYWLGCSAVGPLRLPNLPALFHSGVRALPIATDGGGNAFLEVSGGPILHWNHGTGGMTAVAPDLTCFLRLIATDWEHAAEDDASWLYLTDHRRYDPPAD
jgi:hypothetical protein